MESSVQSRALRRAAEILGGTRELCDYLQVPAGQLARWLRASDVPPAGIFLKAVDVIVEQSAPAEGEQKQQSDPQPPA